MKKWCLSRTDSRKGLGSHLWGLQVWTKGEGIPQNKLSVAAWGDSERKPLDLLGTLMSYFNDLSCHSATLIAANFPQSKKHYQLTLIHQVTVLAFHPRNETLQSAVNRAGHQMLSSAEERAAGLSVERKTDTRIFRWAQHSLQVPAVCNWPKQRVLLGLMFVCNKK